MMGLFLLYFFGIAQPLQAQFASNSVLNSGDWYRVSVTDDGLYTLTYQDLQTLGVPVSSIDPNTLKLYGNGGDMLPLNNADPRHDDLVQLTIEVTGSGDNTFDPGDEIHFYAEGPNVWNYEASRARFVHRTHLFDEEAYYFLTHGGSAGQRIVDAPLVNTTPTHSVNTFNDHQFVEDEQVNLLQSGRNWLGEGYDSGVNTYQHTFDFPNIQVGSTGWVYSAFAANTSGVQNNSSFDVAADGNTIGNISIQGVTTSYTADAARLEADSNTFAASVDQVQIDLTFNPFDANAKGWLDHLEVHVRRNLTMSGSSVLFRDLQSVGTGNVAEYTIQATTAAHRIWEVTDLHGVQSIAATQGGGQSVFRETAETIREYIVFDDNAFQSPQLHGTIANQDLHALSQADLVIVSHPNFLSEAERLADHRRNSDGLSVNVATTEQVYLEFSSGKEDPRAIRDFMRMFYSRGNGSDDPKYLLLMGDGSYDTKGRIQPNTHFVPTWQSDNSLSWLFSSMTEDVFGTLDDFEGENPMDIADLGVGRLPVKTLAEASVVVDKLIHYDSPATFGRWRLNTLWLADDEDGNTHLSQTESLVDELEAIDCTPHAVKYHADQFWQGYDSVENHATFPALTNLITTAVDSGQAMINWVGHGGLFGLAHEHVIDTNSVLAWQNPDRLPVLCTYTADFGRFDWQPSQTISERMLLRDDGGIMGYFGSARHPFSSPGYALSLAFNAALFDPFVDEVRLGDVVRQAKAATSSQGANRLHYLYLGDPSMRFARPEHKVVLTDINGQSAGTFQDTIPVGGTMNLTGEVQDGNGTLLSNFNGPIDVIAIKKQRFFTLAQDANSPQASYWNWTDTLHLGVGVVANGVFSYTMTIPNSADPAYGPAKLLFYAQNGVEDAGGCQTDFAFGDILASDDDIDEDPFAITVFPNPVTDRFAVRVDGLLPDGLSLTVHDVTGRLITTRALNEVRTEIEASNWSSGMYMLTVTDQKGRPVQHEKITVR